MKLMDPKAEREAVGVVKRAIDIAGATPGLSPSSAIIKAAGGHDFTPQMLCRLVEAYNSSASLAHLEGADEEKRAEIIPLADAKVVVDHFFPEVIETATEKAAKYSAPASYEGHERRDFMNEPQTDPLVKAAGEYVMSRPRPRRLSIDKDALYRKIQSGRETGIKRAEQHRTEARRHLHKTADLAAQIGEYFKKHGHAPFTAVESRALGHFGPSVKPLLDHVYKEAHLAALKERRGETEKQAVVLDDSAEPYCFIKLAIEHARNHAEELCKTAEILDATDAEYKSLMSDYREFVKLSEDADPFGPVIGQAGMALKAMKPPIEKSLQPGPRPAVLGSEIADPEHEAQLAAIQQRAILSRMMVDDPVLSAVDPDTVVAAFNELSATAPFVARQPALLKSLLRRRVQQEDVDPFEVKQILEMDTALQKREEPAGSPYQVLA